MSHETLVLLRRWAALLDSRFEIPGTRIRFGIDPLLSLIPGIGELVSPVFAVALLVQGVRQRVPKVVLIRMLGNALMDAFIGAVPVVGTVGDIFWRANARNLALLERHAVPHARPARSNYVFAWGIGILFAFALLLPIAVAIWFVALFWRA